MPRPPPVDAPMGCRRLLVGPSLAGEVARNEHLRDLPTRSAVSTYAGPLYEGLDAGSWPSRSEKRAARQLVIVSALWGASPRGPHSALRLPLCARLVGMDRLEPTWRGPLPPILTDAATPRGPVLDLRSTAYRAVGRPTGLDDQTVTLRIRPSPGGPAHIGDVIAKRVRGEAAGHLFRRWQIRRIPWTSPTSSPHAGRSRSIHPPDGTEPGRSRSSQSHDTAGVGRVSYGPARQPLTILDLSVVAYWRLTHGSVGSASR